MSNPLTQYIADRFLQPAVDARVERALSSKQPVAYGTSQVQEKTLSQAIGRPHDADYSLLYALYKLNTDVSGSVHKWAGGVTGRQYTIKKTDASANAVTVDGACSETIDGATTFAVSTQCHRWLSCRMAPHGSYFRMLR